MLGRSSREMATSSSLKTREILLEIAESWCGHAVDGMARISLCFSLLKNSPVAEICSADVWGAVDALSSAHE
jgi:hypothetical protein